ncbi:MAG: glycosyltransferase family 9 protein [Chloroflexi bacterium]|nr:glycosyltransferase family 9 protein [Chloroflexota bacterium]
MERFTGQQLRERPHVAVLFYDAIGDFVVVTPLLRGLREKYPGCTVDYFGGERTREMEEASPLIDARFSLFGVHDATRDLAGFVAAREAAAGPYDLAINCEFHPANALAVAAIRPTYLVGNGFHADLRRQVDPPTDRPGQVGQAVWTSPDFLEQYGDVVSSTFIGEIFCRMAYVETDFHRTEVPWAAPPFAIPPILISTGASRTAKLWPTSSWERLIRWCEGRGLGVGLLGDRPSGQQAYYHCAEMDEHLLRETGLFDLRGQLTLPQVAGALRQARACATIDNGIMHLAVGVGTPTLALFGASSWQLWAPQVVHLQLALPTVNCTLCLENNFRNVHCLRDSHICMESISPEMAIERLEAMLIRSSGPQPGPALESSPSPEAGLGFTADQSGPVP